MRSFLYLQTADVPAARHFYSDLLGLDEIFCAEDEQTIGYLIGTLQVTIAGHEQASTVPGWASQLGWEGGTKANPSWGFELPADRFAATVEALRSQDRSTAGLWASEPAWVGYWSFPVRDPMGNTVEITTAASDSWPR